MSKKSLNETEICDQYITPAIHAAGWDKHIQVRREYFFTTGQVMVRGKLAVRGKKKRADYLLFHTPNFPIAVVEAKDNTNPVGGISRHNLRARHQTRLTETNATGQSGTAVVRSRTSFGDASAREGSHSRDSAMLS